VLATFAGSRPAGGGTATVGVEGGADWIRSTNLGDHSTSRVSGFAEWRRPVAKTAQIDATVRVDGYNEFGASVSPSLGAGWWPASRLRLRASVGRAFRVPTFTERYYSDPANLARAEVGPEHAWAGEGGADVFIAADWALHATVFGRSEHDVIDWLRPTTTVRWQTYNVRDVNTKGVELSLSRSLARGGFVQVGYTGLDLDASAVDQLSKYVLDYAPHSLTAAASIPLPARLQLAPRLAVRERRREVAGPPAEVEGILDDPVALIGQVALRAPALLGDSGRRCGESERYRGSDQKRSLFECEHQFSLAEMNRGA